MEIRTEAKEPKAGFLVRVKAQITTLGAIVTTANQKPGPLKHGYDPLRAWLKMAGRAP